MPTDPVIYRRNASPEEKNSGSSYLVGVKIKMIDYVNKEKQKAWKGIETGDGNGKTDPPVLSSLPPARQLKRIMKKSGKRKQKCCWMR